MKKLIAIALCALTLGSATVAAPAFSPDVSSPFSISANAAVPERNMYMGQRSETVKWLQWTLTALGYDTKGCDGVYGANTKAAVLRYQMYYGLRPYDGIAGPITIRHINNNALCLQDKLCRTGYPVTKDSILGPASRKAIANFNYNHNISGDIATDATWKALDQSLNYATPLVNGAVYRITPKCAQNSCVDESTCSPTVGGNVHLWQYLGNKNQLWVCEYVGNGFYRLRNLGSGLYLDKSCGGNQPSNVVQYTKNGSYAQNWKIKDCGNGWYNIVNAAENQYLDVNCCRSSNGTEIQTYWNTNCDAQRFKFTRVDSVLNKQAVLNYANTYWNRRNSNYYYYNNNNCCNYVSQCLVAGGLSTNSTFGNGTYAFVTVDGFVRYMRDTMHVQYISKPSASQIEVGDVILTSPGHVMIVTRKEIKKGQVYIYANGNTNNRYQYLISSTYFYGVVKTSSLMR